MVNYGSAAVRERLVPYLMLIFLFGATSLPLIGVQKKDSFPFSTYPMFAGHRGQPTIHRLVAVFKDGSHKTVPPERVASAEVLQTKAILTRAVKGGKKAIQRLCQQVAQNINHDAEFPAAQSLQLEEVRFDSIRYFTEAPEPVFSRILGQCPVGARTEP